MVAREQLKCEIDKYCNGGLIWVKFDCIITAYIVEYSAQRELHIRSNMAFFM